MTLSVGQNTGITTRKPSRIEIWSKAVRSRDGKCLHCGSLSDLHAHHVKPKSTHPELKYELSNGVTLCYRCHKQEHEKNRVRVRSNKPQRRTLYRQIEGLQAEVRALKAQVKAKDKEVAKLRAPLAPAFVARDIEGNPFPALPKLPEDQSQVFTIGTEDNWIMKIWR